MLTETLNSLVDLDPADLVFTPEACSHNRTFYRDNLKGLLHHSEGAGRAKYSWTASRVLTSLGDAPGLVDALDRITSEGWRPTGVQQDSNRRFSVSLEHLSSRWGVQVGVNLDRYSDKVLVLRSSLRQDDPTCSWVA